MPDYNQPNQLSQLLGPQAGQSDTGGIDRDALISLGYMLAEALDPQGFGGNLARGGRKLQQSNILAQERERQQQGLQGALGLTPEGVPGPTKLTIDANGRVTTVGNVGPNGSVQGFGQTGATGQTGQTQSTLEQFRQPTQKSMAGLQQPTPTPTPEAPGGSLQSPFARAQQRRRLELADLLR